MPKGIQDNKKNGGRKLVDELLRQLTNPNLHDIPTHLPFRVELWASIRSAHSLGDSGSSSVAIGTMVRSTLLSRTILISGSPPEWDL